MVPAVLANTSLCAEPSDMMAAAAAAAAVASPAVVRSKVKVPEVVNCPDGDTVTVGGDRHFSSQSLNCPKHSDESELLFRMMSSAF